ncbi:M14 family zinc carboxypeptidase [[Clostridium] polysaccharolyticum]|uniref:Zinc carboxypeptidase n=1 Tax=[Clostridium] polysaccharolyticum TaxID=29364 RepID=A0A1I0ATD5_9FIRM|nr:M14 family zinc carboxypeptidase [[Clostridium] polysaccharolyticum]SES97679.1 Zinc carboxypeptidase [[Clostridium] polysaccharolyticum]
MENVNWDQLFYYEDLVAYAKYLACHYSDLVQYESIGRSWDNRDIFLLKVGKGRDNVIVTGGVHGRESVNPMVLLCMAEYYCEEFRPCLDLVSVYVVPVLNPDGYAIAIQGFDSIKCEKNRRMCELKHIPYYLWKYNGRAVDINRNFPCVSWKKKDVNDVAGSEPETIALMELFQNVSSIGYIDYHSRGKQIYYHRKSMSEDYNRDQFGYACLLNAMTDYELVPPKREIEENDSGGNTVHYYSEQFCLPAITIETVDELACFPLSPHYQRETYEEIKLTPFVFCKDR